LSGPFKNRISQPSAIWARLSWREHFAFDPQRFIAPGPAAGQSYARFLGRQMKESDVILVAEHDSTVIGYVYAALEPHNWKELRDPPAS